MVAAIVKEISSFATQSENNKLIETIYLGGGTPSLLSINDLTSIFETIYAKFKVSEDVEITLEANPDDIGMQKLISWKNIGVNRLSLGIQSFSDEELHWMNRTHNAVQAINCLQMITDAGFTNFSADLIYGSPFCTQDLLESNLETLINFKVPHLSCYALTVEKKTVLHYLVEKTKQVTIDDSLQSEQFLFLMTALPANGYEHYEISNFAIPGFRSRHNSNYWKGIEYFGFGPAAHSFNGNNIRRWNISNNSLYIKHINDGIVTYEEEILTPEQLINEYIMISLRTKEGIDLLKIENEFSLGYESSIENASLKYIQDRKMLKLGNNLILTNKGKNYADGIAADLFV